MQFRSLAAVILTGCVLAGCATSGVPRPKDTSDLTSKDTLNLCKIALTDSDEGYRMAAAKLAVRRGASLEKCQRLMANDQAMMTGIAVVGAAAAVGAAAPGAYGSNYGAAWDRFPNGQWRCRDRATGRFLPDNYCGGAPMYDAWP